ncbi:unnamed protein product [Mytilus coruscus]|uniref:Integrase catalytic domain-containing protein n=1 Tax=Mytilus coruscus TaxID=42192 RepID=A0A6J8D8U6_MYTCO|nr:unnamed protein product [Mytilus coruscus]
MATAPSYKNPPGLTKDKSYQQWKNEVKMWQLVTDLDKKKTGLALALLLQGKPREVALEVDPSDLNVDEGFHSGEDVSMSDYIIEFEQRYNKCKKYDMGLPDAILAFKLLDNAGLSQSHRQLALTACSDLKFDTMKSALNRIFASKYQNVPGERDSVVTVKEESAFVSDGYYQRGRSSRRNCPRNRADRSTNFSRLKTKMNPVFNGNVSRCKICDSKFHWVKDCPHKQLDVNLTEHESDELNETVNITLLTSAQEFKPLTVFVTEDYNAAVIDTACSKKVCGSKWLYEFVESFDPGLDQITCFESHVPFKFGDGQTVYSYQKVKIPALIGSVKCSIETEVVDCEIPLLLSKTSMKRASTILDLSNDKVTMFGQLVDKKREILLKLHKQFGHASSDKLLSLLQSAGSVDSETKTVLKDICSKCLICHKFKHPKAKPVVAFSHANDFNQIVAMDLHEIDHNFYYLHIIDLFSILSAAAIIRRKDSKVIVDKFMQIWVGVYGAPEVGVYTDNGGEFNSQIFRDMAENLNMSVKTTAGYSPWSNGVVERHNATLTETINKMRESSNLSWEMAVSWAVHAKNSLLNMYGYSPYQIVFGRNPNMPSSIVNKPPALEGTTINNVMGKHLSGLHKARKAFIAAESSEKVRRALRKQIRPSGEKFKNGDKVFFLRDNQCGGTYVRVHESRIKRDIDVERKQKITHKHTSKSTHVRKSQAATYNNNNNTEPDHDLVYYESDDEKPLHNDTDNDENQENVEGSADENAADSADQDDSHAGSQNGEDSPESDERDSLDLENQAENDIHEESMEHNAESQANDCRAGKATTDKKSWYNIEYNQPENIRGEQISIDLRTVNDLKVVNQSDDENEDLLLSDIDFTEAKEAELDNWRKHNVYEEVEDNGQNCISTRWVYTMKELENEFHRKARLVAKSFEEDSLDEIPKNSPTCEKQSLRLILSIIANKRWSINSVDIKTAFLQGEKMQREVYLRPPKEAKANGKVWRLNKCVNGLADASLKWYEKVKTTLLDCGGTVSKIDSAVFYWYNEKGLTGVLAVHVDDFLWAGSSSFEESVVSRIRDMFKVGKESCESFKYLGLDLSQENETIVLSQKDYVRMLKTVLIDKDRVKMSPLSPSEQTLLRSKIGQLLWLARQTRPDIAFDVAPISSKIKTSTIEDLKKVNKIIRKVQNDRVSL